MSPRRSLTGLSLSKEERLRRSHQFDQVYTRGRRVSGQRLSVFCLPNQLAFNRLGLSVNKKRFKLSVRRYFIKRRIREAYRRNKLQFLPGHDIVISAHRLDPKDTSTQINSELLALAGKAGLLKSGFSAAQQGAN